MKILPVTSVLVSLAAVPASISSVFAASARACAEVAEVSDEFSSLSFSSNLQKAAGSAVGAGRQNPRLRWKRAVLHSEFKFEA